MDLEQRVQALEQELQILKNQIQTTLLDIQEQLLTNTYPSLQAEERPRSDDPRPAAPAAGPLPQVPPDLAVENTAGRPNVRRVSLDEIGAEPANGSTSSAVDLIARPRHEPTAPSSGETRSPVQARRVSLKAEAAAKTEGGTEASFAPPLGAASGPPKLAKADRATLAQLERWVRKRVHQLGSEGTRRLIEQYAKEGRFTVEVTEELLRLVAVVASDDAAFPPQDEPAPAHSRPRSHPQPGTGSRTERPEGEPDDNSQGVILRLIAGIQNAGAGVRWRRKHG